jgi:ABC-type maltose transport system permease subunit
MRRFLVAIRLLPSSYVATVQVMLSAYGRTPRGYAAACVVAIAGLIAVPYVVYCAAAQLEG